MSARRILHCTRFFYLDSSNGAAVANRALMECLSREGFGTEVLCGPVVDAAPGGDPAAALAEWDPACRWVGTEDHETWTIGTAGVRREDAPHVRATVRGVAITALRRPLRRNTPTDAVEAGEILSLFDATLAWFRPDVLVTYGGDPMTLALLSRARRHGVAIVFTLHNFGYPHPAHFVDVDAILVPSRFSAEHHRRVLGIECVVLPYLIDVDRVRVERTEPGYVTLVNPSAEKGVYVFARIADELGRRRPDIPLLVVESRGEEATLVDCGIDLRDHRNVFLMAQTPDPRDFWGVTRIGLMPSTWWESQGLTAVEALLNGIPVVASDRGALPETLGTAGILIPLPDWLTPATSRLPTPAEVQPWVEAIIRLWDDAAFCAEHRKRAWAEGGRWAPEILRPQYAQFFQTLGPGAP